MIINYKDDLKIRYMIKKVCRYLLIEYISNNRIKLTKNNKSEIINNYVHKDKGIKRVKRELILIDKSLINVKNLDELIIEELLNLDEIE